MSLVNIARRIRERRRALNLTLEQVAGRTGLTQSVLSKVENFRVTPSLHALAKIAKALETSISELTRGIDESPQVVIVPKGKGIQVERDRPQSRIVYELLTGQLAGTLESFMLAIPAGTAREEAMPHEGEEFFHVIQGQILFEYGEETFTLNEGDSAYFNASVPHCINSSAPRAAKVMCVFAPDKRSGLCPNCGAKLFFLNTDSNDSQDATYRLTVEPNGSGSR